MQIWNEIEINQAYNNLLYALHQYSCQQTFDNKQRLIYCERRYRQLSNKTVIIFGSKVMYLFDKTLL